MPMTVQLSEKMKRTIQNLCDEFLKDLPTRCKSIEKGGYATSEDAIKELNETIKSIEKAADKEKYNREYFLASAHDPSGRLCSEKDYDMEKLSALQKELAQQLSSELQKILYIIEQALKKKCYLNIPKLEKYLNNIKDKISKTIITSSETEESDIALTVRYNPKCRRILKDKMENFLGRAAWMRRSGEDAIIDDAKKSYNKLVNYVENIKYSKEYFDLPPGSDRKKALHKKLGEQLVEQLNQKIETLTNPETVLTIRRNIDEKLAKPLAQLLAKKRQINSEISKMFFEETLITSTKERLTKANYLIYKAKKLPSETQESINDFLSDTLPQALSRYRLGGEPTSPQVVQQWAKTDYRGRNNIKSLAEYYKKGVGMINELVQQFNTITGKFTFERGPITKIVNTAKDQFRKLKTICENTRDLFEKAECKKFQELPDKYFSHATWTEENYDIIENIKKTIIKNGISGRT